MIVAIILLLYINDIQVNTSFCKSIFTIVTNVFSWSAISNYYLLSLTLLAHLRASGLFFCFFTISMMTKIYFGFKQQGKNEIYFEIMFKS